MKKELIRLILPVVGVFSVLISGVNAAASIADAPSILPLANAEPFNMMLIGLGFIGFGKAMRIRMENKKAPHQNPKVGLKLYENRAAA